VSASQNGDVLVRVSARTDVGMIRRGNEDCFLVADLTTGNTGLTPEVSHHRLGSMGSLMVVSDGMGGAVAGEIASDLAVNGVRDEMLKPGSTPLDVSQRLQIAVERTNRTVWQYAQDNPHLAGMGATLTAVLCHGNKAYVGQVGDSRAYLVRAGRIKQLTKDQSLVQLLVDAKAIQPDQANQVPNNVILQALGTRPDVVVAVTAVDLCAGDAMLLCSDGLSNKMSADEMRDAIVQNLPDLAGACRRLIELANARGGEDNITALIAQFDGSSLQSSAEQFSITGSMHALTSNDLLRIGGQQLDYYQDTAAASQGPPSVNGVLDNLGMQLIATQPGTNPAQVDASVTSVAIPRLQQPAHTAPPDAPDVVIPPAVHDPATGEATAPLSASPAVQDPAANSATVPLSASPAAHDPAVNSATVPLSSLPASAVPPAFAAPPQAPAHHAAPPQPPPPPAVAPVASVPPAPQVAAPAFPPPVAQSTPTHAAPVPPTKTLDMEPPRKAGKSAGHKVLIGVGVMLILLALLTVAAFAVWFFVFAKGD
jgi:serine/threonine protein phosphatase PrpC